MVRPGRGESSTPRIGFSPPFWAAGWGTAPAPAPLSFVATVDASAELVGGGLTGDGFGDDVGAAACFCLSCASNFLMRSSMASSFLANASLEDCSVDARGSGGLPSAAIVAPAVAARIAAAAVNDFKV